MTKPCGQTECPFYMSGIEVMDRVPLLKWNGVLVVGECPGREEVRRGIPFIGIPGRILQQSLEYVNCSTDNVVVTNAIRCNLTTGRKPSDEQMELARKCCFGELEANIVERKPATILTLGKMALKSVTGLVGVEKFRGATTHQSFEVFDEDGVSEMHECLVVSTIHPAMMTHTSEKHSWLYFFIEDVRKAVHLAEGRMHLFEPSVQRFTYEAVQEILSAPSKLVSLDLETTGIDIRETDITTIGLSTVVWDDELGEDKTLSVSIPCPGLRSGFNTPEYRKTILILKEALENPAMQWIFHNMAFDVPIIERIFEVKISGKIHDTLLMHHTAYPKIPHDLQAVSTQFYAVEPWKAYYDKRFENVSDENIPSLLYYNGADTALTIGIYNSLSSELRRENIYQVYQNDAIITSYAMDWERIGIGVDEEVRSKLYYDFSQSLEDLRARLSDMAEDSNFNPNSPKQLQKLLVDKFKIIPRKLTQSNQLSTDAEALFDFRDHPFVNLLQAYRKDAKLFSTYIDGLAKKVGSDGRIHTRWNKTATPSGRFGTKPAVQNWPDSMREMLIPAPGRRIISADYAALELRISVTLAGEEDLINAFLRGEDIHAMFAEVYFGEVWQEASAPHRKILRKNSKPVTFGDIYRAGPHTLYANVREDLPGVTFEEVATMQARKRAKYENVNAYSAYVTELANKNYELRTPWLGRIRRWPFGGVPDTEATNHPIQGGASDIVDAATIRWIELLKRKGDYHKRVWPVLQLHDDLRAEVVIGYEHEALEDLKNCMRCSKKVLSPITGKTYEMQFEVEGKLGDNHLHLKEVA